MIKIDFKGFWNLVDRELSNHPIIHYLERAEEFVFHFKSKQGCQYWTRISLQEILNFADEDEIDRQTVMTNFYNLYISRCIRVDEITGLEQDDEYFESSLSKEIDPGQDVVEEADDYADFYVKNVQLWKKKILSRLENIEIDKSYMKKTFGQMIEATLNVINTRPFLRVVRRFVKQGMNEGIDTAEKETGVDIGFTSAFEDKLTVLENQQLNGYTIDGKMWYGIKGASKEMQARVLRQIKEDVENKSTKTQMLKNIGAIFDGVGEAQANRIARTETTRFINEGKLTAYKESGVKGFKAWSAVHDNHTSELCDRMHAKYFNKGIPYDEEFVDDATGRRFDYPPAHPNCRSVVEFRLPERKS